MSKNIISKYILEENNICESDLLNLVSEFPSNSNCYGDIYLQNCVNENYVLEQKIIKDSSIQFLNGVGSRLIIDDKTFFSYSDGISFNSIFDSIKKIKFFCFDKMIFKKYNMFFLPNISNYYSFKSPIDNNLSKKKIDLLFYLDNYIRKKDNRIKYVCLNFFSSYDVILIVSTDDIFIGDVRPLIHLSIKVKFEEDNLNELGFSSGGGRYSYDEFVLKKKNNISFVNYIADESIRIGRNNLKAINSPAGNIPIVLGSGWPGVLFHESVGHGLEGDFIRRKTSIYYNMLGKKVASSLCTVVDDGTLYGKRGSLNIDDEGTVTSKNILINDGILKSYMLDKFNANLMNLKSTGNARRQSYCFLPIPRMTNTYLLPGKSKLSDIISSIDYGLYIVNLSGGQVDITSGKFVFTVLEGYLIKNGVISVPVKQSTLIGSGIEIMNKISMVSNDLKFDSGSGTCGKDGQNIPVGVGQPSLKIDSMIVGGIN